MKFSELLDDYMQTREHIEMFGEGHNRRMAVEDHNRAKEAIDEFMWILGNDPAALDLKNPYR